MGQPRPILFLIANFRPAVGGAETQAEGMALTMAAMGQPVEVLTVAVRGAPRREEAGGVVVHRALRIVRLPALWGASHALGAAAFLAARPGRYRALVGFGLQAFHNPAAVRHGRRFRRPVILRCECSGGYGDLATLRGMTAGRWLRSRVDRASAVIAFAPGMRDELVADGIAAERVAIIPNGVDVRLFARPAGAPRRPGQLAFVGRFVDQKGVVDLVRAFGIAARTRPGARLTLLGDGPLLPALHAEAAAAGVADRVSFPGVVPQERVREELAAAAAVLHPSLGEGLSCALLEAMALSCPIVASDLPANRELVRDGREGLLVPPGDAEALAAAVARMLDEPALAERFAAAARRRAEEAFSLEAVARSYLALVGRLEREAALG